MLAIKHSNSMSLVEKKKAKIMTTVTFNLKNGNYLNMTKLFKRKLKRTTKRLNACR